MRLFKGVSPKVDKHEFMSRYKRMQSFIKLSAFISFQIILTTKYLSYNDRYTDKHLRKIVKMFKDNENV